MSKQFKKDLIREAKNLQNNFLDVELNHILEILASDEIIPEKYQDHKLINNWKGFRELHLKPNLLLVYKKENDFIQILKLERLGSHSQIF